MIQFGAFVFTALLFEGIINRLLNYYFDKGIKPVVEENWQY